MIGTAGTRNLLAADQGKDDAGVDPKAAAGEQHFSMPCSPSHACTSSHTAMQTDWRSSHP